MLGICGIYMFTKRMVRAHCPQHSSVHNKYCIENSNQIQSLDLHFNQIWEDFLSIDPPVWTVFKGFLFYFVSNYETYLSNLLWRRSTRKKFWLTFWQCDFLSENPILVRWYKSMKVGCNVTHRENPLKSGHLTIYLCTFHLHL